MSYCVVCACLRTVVSNILSQQMSLRSEFRAVMCATISLIPVFCRRAHVLFMLFVFVCVYSGFQHINYMSNMEGVL